jgi:hypothetical protein
MAFTDAQKAKIRRYLGYPDVFRYANSRLESAIDVIGARAEVQALVEADLTALEAIDAKLLTVASSQGGLKRIDDIEFYEGQAVSQIRSDGRRLAGRLSITFGVPLAGDVFGTAGYTGDEWSRGQTQNGGMFPLG